MKVAPLGCAAGTSSFSSSSFLSLLPSSSSPRSNPGHIKYKVIKLIDHRIPRSDKLADCF